MASARAEIQATAQAQKAVSQGELSMRQQLAAAASLQRQRSAALIADWKKQEAAAKSLASGVKPVSQNLQTLTDIMRQMGASVGVLSGPLNGISGRISSLGTLAKTAGGDLSEMGTAASGAGSSIAAIAGPIGIAVLATAALAAASVAVGKELFDLAVKAADFRGKMFDLSQQTGVAVETLSTLEIAATTTGGSIDSIAQSLVIFQGKLDEAQDPTSKTAIRFKELGISINDTESAFRSALEQIAKMPEGFEQTNTAADLFGRRGGKQVLAIIKELDGDLPGATAKLKALGLVISNEDAKGADEFNDQLAILTFQFRAMLGQQVIPAALVALRTLSDLFKENQRSINGLGQTLGLFSRVALVVLLDKLDQVRTVLTAIEVAAAVLDKLMGHTSLPGLSGGAGGSSPFEGAIGSAQAAERAPRAARATGGGGKSDAQRELEQQLQYIKELNKELADAANAFSGVDIKTKAYAVSQSIANGELEKAAVGLQDMARYAAANIDKIEQEARLTKELNDFRAKQNAAVMMVIEGEKSNIRIASDLIDKLREEGLAVDGVTAFWLRFNAAILDSAERMERFKKAAAEAVPFIPQFSMSDEDIAAAAGEAANAGAGVPPPVPPDVIDSWTILKEASMDAISSMAQGIGGLVQQWVLYGTAGPNAVRKMLAAVLAAAAAQAAVEAIMQLAHAAKEYALGLAAASNPFTAAMAPAHFAAASAHVIAAGVYGAVAGVAAVSGRVIAGDTFNQSQGAGQGARGGSGGSGSSSSPRTIEVDRRQGLQSSSTPQQLIVKIQPPEGWVGNEFRKDWDLNGVTRLTVTTDRG